MKRFGACDSWLLRRSCTNFSPPRVRGKVAQVPTASADRRRRRPSPTPAERCRLPAGQAAEHRGRPTRALGLHEQVRTVATPQPMQRRRPEQVVARQCGRAASARPRARPRRRRAPAPSPARARGGGTADSRAASRRASSPSRNSVDRVAGGEPHRAALRLPRLHRARARRCPRGPPGPRAGRAARTCAPRAEVGLRPGRGRRRCTPRAGRRRSDAPSRRAACRRAPCGRVAPKRSSVSSSAPDAGHESASRRSTSRSAKRSAISASSRSVPAPSRAMSTAPQSGQRCGIALRDAPQWWQSSAAGRGGASTRRRSAVHGKPRPHGAAVQRGRLAAAVQEQDRPPAPRRSPPSAVVQRPRDRIGAVAAQVDDVDRRQRAADAPWQLEPLERAPRLGPRRRGRETARRRLPRGHAAPRARGRRSAGRRPACRRLSCSSSTTTGRGRRRARRGPSAGRRRWSPRHARCGAYSAARSPARERRVEHRDARRRSGR